uniref:G2/mitotic-specific cyclin-B2 n=1 Tax=Mola mola TaxID=94237 RepID=A0A3Q3WNP3_MOLML
GWLRKFLPLSSSLLAGEQAKQRTVLGVLSENELRSRSFSQASERGVRPPFSPLQDFTLQQPLFFSTGEPVVQMQLEHGQLPAHLPRWSSDESLTTEEVLCVSEYAGDIHQHLKEREVFRPKPGYLENHPEVTAGMRVVVVDWLAEVVQEYKLQSETLHLAVNYLDRFLSRTAHVKRVKLQLVGTAALLIAAKYEEIFPPEMDEFVYITDSTYSRRQLAHMEHAFLKVLDFKMAAPTTHQFLSLFMSIHPVCAITENLALYVAELSLLEVDLFPRYTPSVVAAAAYSLAAYTVSKSLWPDSLHTFTGYTVVDILPCVTDLHQLYVSAETHPQQAIRGKYMSSKYCRVSLIPPPNVLSFA